MVRPYATYAACLLGAMLAGRAALSEPAAVPAPPPNPSAPAAAATGPGPHIKFDTTSVNLGDVVRGADAVATFTYHNTGDAPLRILSAKPG